MRPITLLFDGACPLCRLEMDRLRERDTHGRLAFIDIAAPGFDATGLSSTATLADMQRLMHAVRPDGSLAVGVDALCLAYEAVGLGVLWRPMRWWWLRPLADHAYAGFAHNRYGISRFAMPLIARIEARRAWRRTQACASGTCTMDQERSSP